ncbi:MAG: DUF1425 domain-containing protein [Phycisphaerales bacterium]|nr:DUF1425 domain-containing protein [Hyphomonadaceae bacterium]
MKLSRRILFAAIVAFTAPAFAQTDAQHLTVNMETRGLARRVELGAAQFRPVGRYQLVELQAQNVTSRDQHVEYKIDWFDREGFSVQTASTWQRLHLSPQAFEAIRSVGQVDTAYSARLTIRDSD